MQFSQIEQLQNIKFPNADEIIIKIDNGEKISTVLRDLHQIIDHVKKIASKTHQPDFNSLIHQNVSIFLTQDLPQIIVALIYSSPNVDHIKNLYEEFIQLTILFQFHFNLLKSLNYIFQHTEKVQRPPKKISAISISSSSNPNLNKSEPKKPNSELHSSISSNFSASKPASDKNISTFTPKLQHPSIQTRKGHHVSAPLTPTSHSSHNNSSVQSPSSAIFSIENIEENYQDVLKEFSKSLISVFDKIETIIQESRYDFIQFCSILELFLSIEPYLSENVGYTHATFFIPYMIENIQKIQANSQTFDLSLFKFISAFSNLIEKEDIKTVYLALTNALNDINNGALINEKKIATKCVLDTIISVFSNHGPAECGDILKDSLLNTIYKSMDDLILEEMYKFLPDFNSKFALKVEDIARIYFHVTTLPKIVTDSVLSLISNPKRDHLDLIAKSVLSYQYFSPLLTMYLIDHTDAQSVYMGLFYKLITNISIGTQISHRGRMSTRFQDIIKSELSSMYKLSKMIIENVKNKEKTVKSIIDSRLFMAKMGIFLIKISSAENMQLFINNLIAIRDDAPEVEDAFNAFIDILSPNELERYYVSVFDGIFDVLNAKPLSSNDNHFWIQKQRLTNILIKWTNSLISMPDSIMSHLASIDFTHLNTNVTQVINAVLAKSTNKKSRRNLAFAIAYSTVKPKFASWAMRTIETICNKGRNASNKEFAPAYSNNNNSNFSNSGFGSSINNSNSGGLHLNNSNSIDSIEGISSSPPLSSSNSGNTLNSASNIMAAVEDSHASNMSKICDILVRNVTDETKRKNTIHMIMWCAMLECDFYRIKGKSFFSQKISFEFASKKYEFDLSFHPFHSMRRIYAAVSEAISQPICILNVSIANESDTLLKIDDPLSNFIFNTNPNTVIYLNVSLKQDVSIYDNFPQCHLNTVPKFLNRLEEIDNGILREFFMPFSEEGEIICQILMLVDQSSSYSKDLFLIGDLHTFFQSFDFSEYTRIFPILLHILSESDSEFPQDFNETILDALCDYNYGNVGLSIACRSISKLFTNYSFSKRIIKKCLLDTNWPIIRKTIATMLLETPPETIISFLDIAVKSEYRTKTQQYFELINKIISINNSKSGSNNATAKNLLNPDIFLPFFLNLEPFEMSHYIDADETFIGLISLLKPSDDTLDVVFERLFAAPTVKNPHLPFCQTIESRRAAFDYISKCLGNSTMKNKIDKLIKSLMDVPEFTSRLLSDDLSFVGRNIVVGCPNNSALGSIISLLTNVEPLIEWLFHMDEAQMAPHIVALREFMSMIIFSREGKVDIRPLLDYPQFSRVINMPCDVILSQLFTVVDNSVNSSYGLHSIFNFYINSNPISFISLKVKGYQNMEKSLNDYIQSNSDMNSSTYRWPEYLLIYLNRIENGNKITDQFEFPLFFSDQQYSFIGAVLQSGAKTDGRFLTLSTNYNDWFVTSTDQIEYFNQADIPFWCYGSNDEILQNQEDFTCATILLYHRSLDRTTLKSPLNFNKIKIPGKLEEKINQFNQSIWSSIVLSSPLFVNLVLKLNNNEIIFNTLFRICLYDIDKLEEMIPKFKSIILKNSNSISQFKEFSFSHGIEKITNVSLDLSFLLSKLYVKVLNNADYLKEMIDIFKKDNSEYQYYFFLNIMIENYLQCEINTELMYSSLEYLSQGRMNAFSNDPNSNDFIHCSEIVLASQQTLFDLLIKAVIKNVKFFKEFEKVINFIFDVDFLEKWSAVIIKDDAFKHLIEVTSNYYQNIFSSIISVAPQLEELFSKYVIKDSPFSNLNETIKIIDDVWNDVIVSNIFNPNKSVRDIILSICSNILPKPEKEMENYIQRRIIDDTVKKPHINESAFGFQFMALLPEALKVLPEDNDLCDVYSEIVESRICYISPVIVSTHLNDFFSLLNIANDSNIIEWLLMTIHHILAFDKSKASKLNSDQVDKLLSPNFGTIYAIQLLYLFRDRANGSPLSGSCFEDCFQTFFDEHSAILLKMIREGLIIGPFSLDLSNTRPKDLLNLELINAIYKNQPEHRRSIYLCIKKVIDPIKEFLLLGSSKVISDSMEILELFKNEEEEKNEDFKENNLIIDDDKLSQSEDDMMQYELYHNQKNKTSKKSTSLKESNSSSNLNKKSKVSQKSSDISRKNSYDSLTKNKKKEKIKSRKTSQMLIDDSEDDATEEYEEDNESQSEPNEEEEEEEEEEISKNSKQHKSSSKINEERFSKTKLIKMYKSLSSLSNESKINKEQKDFLKEISKEFKGRPAKKLDSILTQLRAYLKEQNIDVGEPKEAKQGTPAVSSTATNKSKSKTNLQSSVKKVEKTSTKKKVSSTKAKPTRISPRRAALLSEGKHSSSQSKSQKVTRTEKKTTANLETTKKNQNSKQKKQKETKKTAPVKSSNKKNAKNVKKKSAALSKKQLQEEEDEIDAKEEILEATDDEYEHEEEYFSTEDNFSEDEDFQIGTKKKPKKPKKQGNSHPNKKFVFSGNLQQPIQPPFQFHIPIETVKSAQKGGNQWSIQQLIEMLQKINEIPANRVAFSKLIQPHKQARAHQQNAQNFVITMPQINNIPNATLPVQIDQMTNFPQNERVQQKDKNTKENQKKEIIIDEEDAIVEEEEIEEETEEEEEEEEEETLEEEEEEEEEVSEASK